MKRKLNSPLRHMSPSSLPPKEKRERRDGERARARDAADAARLARRRARERAAEEARERELVAEAKKARDARGGEAAPPMSSTRGSQPFLLACAARGRLELV